MAEKNLATDTHRPTRTQKATNRLPKENPFHFDELVKSPESVIAPWRYPVIQTLLDPGLRRDDVEQTFYEPIHFETR
jgi:hypothetical protein